ncbi:hypothetical protein IGI04_029356 [Brassica rapa subsp. trilocularis]|uniref:Uncharacterized protein n=1 Tax=Brassica rapa subsp. trilocularis TaxID=1813537 RepID=A0ABQ7LPB8_BRACM|nr:hypothetical protein IGI04_029356 [Brassica rapa subsp. trilocularis]
MTLFFVCTTFLQSRVDWFSNLPRITKPETVASSLIRESETCGEIGKAKMNAFDATVIWDEQGSS